jgi:hypothetical protein
LHCLNTIMVVRGRAFAAEIRFKHPTVGLAAVCEL